MTPDHFSSHIVSAVLSWLCSIPIFFGVLISGVGMLFGSGGSTAGERVFVGWIALCILILSPLRYFMLQFIFASTYAVQSFSALFSVVILAFYIPIVWVLHIGLTNRVACILDAQAGERQSALIG